MGELGLLPDEFYKMTWADYSRYYQGYWLRHARTLEASRMIAYTILQVNTVKGKHLPPPSRLWPLITDSAPEAVAPIPIEEFNALAERYK